jgi:adenylyltransferase/sulfurtransferase
VSGTTDPPLTLADGRFARLEQIEWWDQARLRDARILVVGAGALGNEVLKNLALVGAGKIVVIDMDRIELSNLSRSVLFREADEGQPKASTAAQAVRSLYHDVEIVPIVGNVMSDVGLGYFRWAQVVVGALDNREARVFVNSACAMVGRPWIDGGIDVLQGIVRGFAPPATACYECTMSRVDWELLNQRRSCSLLARRSAVGGGTPTTPTTASVVGAIQVQEVVKLLHGTDALLGRGVVFDGAANTSYPVTYSVAPDCGWHEPAPRIVAARDLDSNAPLAAVLERATGALGAVESLDFSRDVVAAVECPACGDRHDVYAPLDRVTEDDALCRSCGEECFPHLLHSVSPGDELLDRTVREVGLPTWDILWGRRGEDAVGIEISGDSAFREHPAD